MKLILCVALIIVVVCYLTVFIIRQNNDIKKQLENLESEKTEQNKRLIILEKQINKIEKEDIDEKRDNSRKNQTSYKSIRRNR